MAGGFAGFEIARSGMVTNERALAVTGHNISNVNTVGYSRQQAIQTSAIYTGFDNKHQIGLGATIQEIRQIRHSFLDNIYRKENTNLGYWEARTKTFQDIQSILGEPMETGMQEVKNQFWDSWQELSKAPDNLTARAMVIQRGEAFVQYVNHVGKQLDKMQEDLNTEIGVQTSRINDIAKGIAELNKSILYEELNGNRANDYRDQRNLLVDQLANLVDVNAIEASDGQLDILVGGQILVAKGVHRELYARETLETGSFHTPLFVDTDEPLMVNNGLLKGLLESRGEVYANPGSIENGTPNTRVDITFAIDVSDTSTAYLDDIKASITSYVNELNNRGLDYNLTLVAYGDNIHSSAQFGEDEEAFLNAVNLLTTTGETGNNTEDLINELSTGITYRENANKYAVLFTAESLGGNEQTIDLSDAENYIQLLNENGINLSVITDPAYYEAGSPAGAVGWGALTGATNGQTYDVNNPEYDSLMTNIMNDINSNINKEISLVENSGNTITDIKKKLNALVNIIVREVNYIHRSGKTYSNPPQDGDDFFTPIFTDRPMEMANIRLNSNLSNLNNVVASGSGDVGDNTIALKMSNLRHRPIAYDKQGFLSTDDYYHSIVLAVGMDGAESERIVENQRRLVHSADQQRNAIIGVSMDEEMGKIIKYKYAYTASAKALNLMDQMLDTIINRMGR